MKKICIVTGSRADYGLFYPTLKKIKQSDKLILQLVATTMHFSAECGNTFQEIEANGFTIDERIENLLVSNTNTAICKSTGLALSMLSDAYSRLKPDVVLLLGDRFETHAAATAALLMNIPIAHIHGGESSENAIDEQIRHSITKMSHLHFVSTETYRNRVIQMGEYPDKVIVSGATGIDNIVSLNLMSRQALEQNLNWKFGKKTILFTYHPETLLIDDVEKTIKLILRALDQLDKSFHVLFTAANADAGGAIVNRAISDFVSRDLERYKLVKSLGQLRYLSAMKEVDCLVGNTSSGIIEAASFHKPVVNVGDRQKGRLQSGNIVNANIDNILTGIEQALSPQFLDHCEKVKNIYGEGNASDIIVENLEKIDVSIKKDFYTIGQEIN